MLKCLAFDMDGTLLDINLSAFIAFYAKDFAGMVADIGRKSLVSVTAQLGATLLDLNNNAREDDDRRRNRDYVFEQVWNRCGVMMDDPVVAEAFEYYEREVLPARNHKLIDAEPMKGSAEILELAQSRGLKVALLTNPSFSRACIECRMGWGELLDVPFELVTSWENSTRCKPSATYYQESLAKMGLAPEEVLMVGNDPKRDFCSPDIGLQTAYVGGGAAARALWRGRLDEMAPHFDEIEELFYRKQEAEA